jgi:hypothetical protein
MKIENHNTGILSTGLFGKNVISKGHGSFRWSNENALLRQTFKYLFDRLINGLARTIGGGLLSLLLLDSE